MLSGELWPAHPHPLHNELLTCWIVRTAHANGLKAQTFCEQVFGKEFQIWNRDIDRNAPAWLLNIMSSKTGTLKKTVQNSTVALYESRLFPTLHSYSQLRWFMPVKKHHRVNKGYALQYCPLCLGEDPTPYFRLSWRLALYTFCSKHKVLMMDRCQHCQEPVMFHRVEQGKPKKIDVETLDSCWHCSQPLSSAIAEPIQLIPKLVDMKWTSLLRSIDRQFYPAGGLNFQNITLLHQLCRLLSSKKYRPKLAKYISDKVGYPSLELEPASLIFEQRSIQERHAILQMAWWLMTNRKRIKTAIKEKALRINWLYRDLDNKQYVLNKFRTDLHLKKD